MDQKVTLDWNSDSDNNPLAHFKHGITDAKAQTGSE